MMRRDAEYMNLSKTGRMESFIFLSTKGRFTAELQVIFKPTIGITMVILKGRYKIEQFIHQNSCITGLSAQCHSHANLGLAVKTWKLKAKKQRNENAN